MYSYLNDPMNCTQQTLGTTQTYIKLIVTQLNTMKLFIKKREKEGGDAEKGEEEDGGRKRRRKREEREQANRLGNTTVTDDTTIPLIHEGLAPGPSLDTNINRCSGPLYKMM